MSVRDINGILLHFVYTWLLFMNGLRWGSTFLFLFYFIYFFFIFRFLLALNFKKFMEEDGGKNRKNMFGLAFSRDWDGIKPKEGKKHNNKLMFSSAKNETWYNMQYNHVEYLWIWVLEWYGRIFFGMKFDGYFSVQCRIKFWFIPNFIKFKVLTKLKFKAIFNYNPGQFDTTHYPNRLSTNNNPSQKFKK